MCDKTNGVEIFDARSTHHMKKALRIKYDIIFLFASLLVTYVVLFCSMQIWSLNIRIPFEYRGDVFGVLSEIKNMIRGNGIYYNPDIAAPFGSNQSISKGYLVHIAILWVMTRFSRDPAFILNVFYLLTFGLTTFTAYVSLRLVNIRHVFASVGAVLYSFLPYHFFRYEQHIYLSAYYLLPLSCVAVFWLMNGSLCGIEIREKKRISFATLIRSGCNTKMILSVLFVFIIGLSDLYYSVFLAMIIAFATLCGLINSKKARSAFYGGVLLVTLFAGIGLCFIPTISNQSITQFAVRTPSELDYYSLRIAQLLMPIQNNRIDALEMIRKKYDSSFKYITENSMASLGLYMSFGFVLSIFSLFFNKIQNAHNNLIRNTGLLNMYVVIIAVSGGISSIIGVYVTSSIRCYNRMVVFVAFFAVTTASCYFDYLYHKLSKKSSKIVFVVALLCVFAGGILSQLPKDVASGSYFDPEKGKYLLTNEEIAAYYNRDKSFIEQIESTAKPGLKVLQLPIISNTLSNVYENGALGAYTQMSPYILSTKDISWSYGSYINDRTDMWLKNIIKYSIEDQIKLSVLQGFKGVYLDKMGYDEAEFQETIERIKNLTGAQYITSSDGDLYYADITDFADQYIANITNEEKNRYEMINNTSIKFVNGAYGDEKNDNKNTWNWLRDKSTMSIYNWSDTSRLIHLSFYANTLSSDPSTLNITTMAGTVSYSINDIATLIEVDVIIEPGNNTLVIETDAEHIDVKDDERDMRVCISDIQYN